MAEVIRMPRMSDTMTEGVIVEWHKKVGDKVKSGDLLAEVETDKATMELESYNDGTLLYIGVEKGKPALVDGILAVIGKEGEDYKAALDAAGRQLHQKPKRRGSIKQQAPAKRTDTCKKLHRQQKRTGKGTPHRQHSCTGKSGITRRCKRNQDAIAE